MENKKIFLIEDNSQLIKYIKDYLEVYGYKVYLVNDYQNLISEIEEVSPDLILLDINLPEFDGFYFLKLIRKTHMIPVIIISARSEESEQIRGIESGADDYLTKPFSTGLLLAKISAIFRRETYSVESGAYGLILDEAKMKILYKELSLDLSKNEFKILNILIKNHGQIVSRENILEELWDDASFVDDNTLTVNITRVKKKLNELGLTEVIKTKRGVGYVLEISNN